MGLTSILLAVVSVLFVALGFVTFPIPAVGTLFSFGAPTLALAGVVVGGIGMSRARREGRSTDAALAGVILSTLALVPALLVALTCGLCNAACSTGEVETQRNFDMRFGGPPSPARTDAGAARPPSPPPDAPSPPVPPGAPPPAFPPPPVGKPEPP